jgi:hypothetical protein
MPGEASGFAPAKRRSADLPVGARRERDSPEGPLEMRARWGASWLPW